MSASPDDELVAELSREVVALAAPHELPLFRATSAAYFRDPDQVLKRRGSRDEMLGFGGADLMALTPYVLAVATPVVRYLFDEVATVAREEGSAVIRQVVRRMFDRSPDSGGVTAVEPVSLNPDQLRRVRELTMEKAKELELPEGKAELLADSVVGRLATAG